jgi:hypothetical protein
MYENDLVNFMINNVSKPVIICLDFNNYTSNIQKLFDLMKKIKRLFNDIIIVNNISKEDDIVYELKKATNKIVWSTIYNNNLIIMPQLE